MFECIPLSLGHGVDEFIHVAGNVRGPQQAELEESTISGLPLQQRILPCAPISAMLMKLAEFLDCDLLEHERYGIWDWSGAEDFVESNKHLFTLTPSLMKGDLLIFNRKPAQGHQTPMHEMNWNHQGKDAST